MDYQNKWEFILLFHSMESNYAICFRWNELVVMDFVVVVVVIVVVLVEWSVVSIAGR